jgi:hypothetical protein
VMDGGDVPIGTSPPIRNLCSFSLTLSVSAERAARLEAWCENSPRLGRPTAVHAQREGSPEPVVRNPRTIWWKN